MTIHDLVRPTTEHRSAAQALRGLCDGAVHLPGDPGFDAARMAWNLAVDQHPAAVAHPADARQTAQVVRAAAAAWSSSMARRSPAISAAPRSSPRCGICTPRSKP